MTRILYLVSEDWYFLSHRLPMARAARQAGYEVHVATRVSNGAAAIRAEGFELHPLAWRRASRNPMTFIKDILLVRRLYRSLAPDLVHQVALWTSIVGSLAALGLGMQRLSALAGLGFAFTSNTYQARFARAFLRPLLRHLFGGPHSFVLVQNPDDYASMTAIGVSPSRLFVIPGSGVDTNQLQPLPEPSGPTTAAYVGRLLADKGLRNLIRAQARLTARGQTLRLLIAGEPDPANPASIPLQEIENWRSHAGVELLGHVSDVSTVWAQAHIAVMPSRREGLPKSLLEAAACGRPIVATDVPGNREIARLYLNALLVPVDDESALADALAELAENANLRARLGAAGRVLAECEFSNARVGTEIMELYHKLLLQNSEVSSLNGPRG